METIFTDSLTTGTSSTVKPSLNSQGTLDSILAGLKGFTNRTLNQPQFGFNNATQTVNTINAGIQGVSALGNLYLGFESLSLAKKSAKMEEDKWKQQKEEIDHLREVRKRLTERF